MAGRTISKTLFTCLFALALAAVVALAPLPGLTQTALADVGGFAGDTDYGGGNDNDYGGGNDYGWDNNDDWDNDDNDWGWTWGNDNDDNDWGDTGGYSRDYDDADGDLTDDEKMLLGAVLAIILVAVAASLVKRRRNASAARTRKTVQNVRPQGASRTSDSQLRPIAKLQERDPGFSAADIEELIANVYVRMQNAWTAGDFEPMRPYFSNTLFAQLASQLGALRAKGKTNYVENIAVLETTVRGWYESHDEEHLIMKVRTRITDYTVDNATGNVVGGYKDSESFMEYEYDLVRPAGTKTQTQQSQTVVGECPNCGAPIDLAQSARCEYCGSVIESAQHTWVIDKMKGISQHIAR